jgi:hypothetical protein
MARKTTQFFPRKFMYSSRKILMLAALCGLAWSQTGLTTIQDTLFKADGTRFTGTITIHWSTFDSADIGTIVQQSKSVQVVNGNLQVQLTPNASAQSPANTYTVQYQSDGREQFGETWTVPASTRALKVSEVRTGGLTTGGGTTTGNQTPIPESAVVGLQADLNQRPIKGAGFGTNRVAIVDDNGVLQTAAGNVGDCVLVDGTTGPCGSLPPIFIDGEMPGGIVDGANRTFTLSNIPSGLSLMLFRNGLYLTAGFDYTLTGSTFQFVAGAAPQPGDQFIASYRVDPIAAANIGAITADGGSLRTTAAQVICSAAGLSTSSATFTTLGACDVPAAGLKPGDRIELRFSFAHTGTAGFDLQVNWGTTTALTRHSTGTDVALAGNAEAAITATGAQLTVQSWGTVLPFVPGILNSGIQNGLRIDLRASVSKSADTVTLTNYTVLRYPGN